MPKTAKKFARSYELQCPYCDATIPAKGGSLFWETGEIYSGQIVQCAECGKEVKLPKA